MPEFPLGLTMGMMLSLPMLLVGGWLAIEDRTEKHYDAVDKWKAECSNKPYDENDEKAIRKEKAAAAGK